MALKQKKGKPVDKWRKKKYFSVLAPKMFQERELGQSIAYDSNSLDGRTIKTDLMVLSGNIKNQDINLTFKVNKVLGDTAYTFVEKYELSPSSIKRKVRRNRDRLDESIKCVTKDNKIIRIKPLIITRVQTSRAVRTLLIKEITQFLFAAIRKTDYDSLVMDIINEKLQKDIANRFKKIVPLKFVNIRFFQYLGEQKSALVEEPVSVEDSSEKQEKGAENIEKSEKKKAKDASNADSSGAEQAKPKKPAVKDAVDEDLDSDESFESSADESEDALKA